MQKHKYTEPQYENPDREKGARVGSIPPQAFGFCCHCGEQLKLTGGPDVGTYAESFFIDPDHKCKFLKIEAPND